MNYIACPGCGAKYPEQQCFGCNHEFYPTENDPPKETSEQRLAKATQIIRSLAYALPKEISTTKTCYAVNDDLRDAIHEFLKK